MARDFSSMPEGMLPQPFRALPGTSVFVSFTAVKNLEEATGRPLSSIMQDLLLGNLSAIEEAAARAILNPDGSIWSGAIDDIAVPTLELGRILADAVHRRLFGRPLEIEGAE